MRNAIPGALALALLAPPAAARGPSPQEFNAAQSTAPRPNLVANFGQAVRASWYGGGERLAAFTASGERFNPSARTCAHRTLPFGTRLEVTYHGRSTVVRVNDRGPAASTGRAIDLSRAAASDIGLTAAGSGDVTIRVLK